jgi:acetyl-CoA C-acetyltransferase
MPTRPFAPENPDLYQATLDAMPKPAFAELAQGAATVETYTVIHDKAGPSGGLLFGRLPDGTRFMANTPTDRGLLDDMESREFIGVQGSVVNDGKTNVFSPA